MEVTQAASSKQAVIECGCGGRDPSWVMTDFGRGGSRIKGQDLYHHGAATGLLNTVLQPLYL